MSLTSYFSFLGKRRRITDHHGDDVFYIYPDSLQEKFPEPENLDDAYGNGFLVIEAQDPGAYYLRIENQEFIDSDYNALEKILFTWSISEGYCW